MRYTAILFVLAALCLPVASAQCDGRFVDAPTDTFSIEADLLFGGNTNSDGEFQELRLDLYVPNGAPEEKRPLVVLAHGGSFISGGKRDAEVRWICEDLARRGVLAASIEYRVASDPLALLSEESMVKAVIRAVEDIKASLRYFYKSIGEGNPYAIDPEAIFLGGSSAGSIAGLHTVFMNDYSLLRPRYQRWFLDLGIDPASLEGNSGNPGYSGNLAGLINISGAIVEVRFLDDPVDLPLLSIHNEIDLSVPYMFGFPYFLPTLPMVAGSRPIHLHRQQLGAPSKLITVQGINHVPHTAWDGTKFQPVYDRILGDILYFIETYSPCTDLVTAVDEHQSSRLSVYPNPAGSLVHIEGLSAGERKAVWLISPDGRKLSLPTDHRDNAVPLPDDLPGGHYVLQAEGLETGRLQSAPLMILR